MKPTVTISLNATDPVKAGQVEITLVFSEGMKAAPVPTIAGNLTNALFNMTTEKGWTALSNTTYSINATVQGSYNGSALVTVTLAQDLATNVMLSTNTTLYIDTVNPTLPTALASSTTVNSVTITWTAATDLGSGMASYKIYKGGVLLGTVASGVTTYTDTGLVASGTLSYVVQAVDLAGNTQDSAAKSVTFVLGDVTEWEISLYEGWNLISLPLIPDDTAIATVLADVLVNVTKVWSYDESTDTWLSYVPGGPPSLTTMVDGEGYWIEMSGNSTLTVHGVEMPAPPALPPTYDLVAGWNLIGYKALEAMNASTYLGPSVAADAIRIYGYTDGSYIGVALSANMSPGMGYWIAMDDTGTIYP